MRFHNNGGRLNKTADVSLDTVLRTVYSSLSSSRLSLTNLPPTRQCSVWATILMLVIHLALMVRHNTRPCEYRPRPSELRHYYPPRRTQGLGFEKTEEEGRNGEPDLALLGHASSFVLLPTVDAIIDDGRWSSICIICPLAHAPVRRVSPCRSTQ